MIKKLIFLVIGSPVIAAIIRFLGKYYLIQKQSNQFVFTDKKLALAYSSFEENDRLRIIFKRNPTRNERFFCNKNSSEPEIIKEYIEHNWCLFITSQLKIAFPKRFYSPAGVFNEFFTIPFMLIITIAIMLEFFFQLILPGFNNQLSLLDLFTGSIIVTFCIISLIAFSYFLLWQVKNLTNYSAAIYY